MKHTFAIAALVATSISFVALPVMAQTAAAPAAGPVAVKADRTVRDGGMGRGGGFLNLVCAPRGAEQLDIALVRLSYRLDLTAEQTALFDTFKTNALTTQTSFADDCATAMPAADANAQPDLLAGFKARLALEESRLKALNAVLPDFEAFYASLTDAQKANLMPNRMMRHDDRGGHDRGGPDRGGRNASPDRGNGNDRDNTTDRSLRAPAPGR